MPEQNGSTTGHPKTGAPAPTTGTDAGTTSGTELETPNDHGRPAGGNG